VYLLLCARLAPETVFIVHRLKKAPFLAFQVMAIAIHNNSDVPTGFWCVERRIRRVVACHLRVRWVFDSLRGKDVHKCGKCCGQLGKMLFIGVSLGSLKP
jgi:hypothetical protein